MILEEILARTEERVARLGTDLSNSSLPPARSLKNAIMSCTDRNAVIAEVKFASPSRGRIAPAEAGTPAALAKEFVAAGAVGLSVLTEPSFFGGSTENLASIREVTDVPLLRKDFIIDERQLAETRLLGADAVLLIARVLGGRLPAFVDTALALGIEPLVEVHSREEMALALQTRAGLIGINNRNLRTLAVDLSTTPRLFAMAAGSGRVVVSESGILWPCDVRQLRGSCDAFLIGSAIMASKNRRHRLEGFVYA
ncbi:MAG: indole-3-glycerol-phosphate synthase [Methanomicrobiales archaeon]|nr:indole-3-glycerol-phosphate synthase [Methanomicrobiales archaeon]